MKEYLYFLWGAFFIGSIWVAYILPEHPLGILAIIFIVASGLVAAIDIIIKT